jgi:DNA (cytosine-5)-methyltransferase 1
MKYLSVCSGIEAATVAWHHMGWTPAGFSEIEPFPSAVLQHHYPTVTNFGDMTKYKEWNLEPIDLLVGGTPCQSFSVAGLRKGLDDPRGNLALTYCGILDHFRPKWFIWENVPGVLSSGEGRDFGSFLGAVAELGYGFAYRVLDAQYFGVPQRRRRVFVVGYLGDWRPAAEVLFESEGLSRNPPPSKQKEQDPTTFFESSLAQYRQADVGGTLKASGGVLSGGSETFVTEVFEYHPNDSRVKEMGDICQTVTSRWGTGGGNVPIALAENTIGRQPENGGNGMGFTEGGPMYTLNATGIHGVAQFVDVYNQAIDGQVSATMTNACGGSNTSGPKIMENMVVRKLTPIECERLQGFQDEYTNIPWRKSEESPDGLRYKALGNSMAVPVMKWIGERINAR